MAKLFPNSASPLPSPAAIEYSASNAVIWEGLPARFIGRHSAFSLVAIARKLYVSACHIIGIPLIQFRQTSLPEGIVLFGYSIAKLDDCLAVRYVVLRRVYVTRTSRDAATIVASTAIASPTLSPMEGRTFLSTLSGSDELFSHSAVKA